MPEQIALIEAPIYETTGEHADTVTYEIAAFDLLGTRVSARIDEKDELIEIAIGQRRFVVSILDLAATAAIAVEGHLKGEIIDRVRASRAAPTPRHDGTTTPLVGLARAAAETMREIEQDGFVTVVPGPWKPVTLASQDKGRS